MAEDTAPPNRWFELVTVLVAAALTVVVADLGFRRVSPPKYVREIQDAMAEYEHDKDLENPTVLVLGSSHARTFAAMDRLTRERTGGRTRIMAVPLEWGKFRSYEWVLNHRLRPLIEDKSKRPSLRHVIMLTAWWDTCVEPGDPPVFNLPSRAWTFPDFADAVIEDGLNDHSRNYVTSRWLDLWHGSILASDRGHGHLISGLRERIKPLSEDAKKKQFEMKLTSWRGIMEHGVETLNNPQELAAAERILKYFQDNGYDVTLMLYPMMPITVTEFSRQNVQIPFQAKMKELAAKMNIRFIDTTFDHNVEDADFQQDFDHLNPAGHIKFGNWLLDGQLSFLLEDDTPKSAGAHAGKQP